MTFAVTEPDPTRVVRNSNAAGDSITVAGWTLISRVTGVVKIAAIGAVLGPTFFGNAYQFTNSLPNLIYYGFLAGSLFSSLLVPALVRHLDAGDRAASERVVGGFLGTRLVALLAILPLAVLLGPLVLRLATFGGAASVGQAQEQVGRWLILMFIPQVFLYGVVGAATSAMNARRRFALAAAAPALENIGTIVVLGACAVLYGTGTRVEEVPTGELVLLGLGTTGAVAVHATAQWWGARRAGVRLIPRAGWRDPEVRVVVRRALPSLAQAGLVALQVLSLLVLANRVAGGVVAFQIALNFFFLAIALGATPVALSLLPRLARMHVDGEVSAFHETLRHGFALGLFVAIPAAVGYLGLSLPLARAVSFGRMGTHDGVILVAASLAALSVAVIAQTVFMIATFASYAREDTGSPLVSMVLQAVTCVSLASLSVFVHGWAVLVVLGSAYSVSIAVAALHLAAHLGGQLGAARDRLAPSLARAAVGAVVMIGPAWLTVIAVTHWFGRPLGPPAARAADGSAWPSSTTLPPKPCPGSCATTSSPARPWTPTGGRAIDRCPGSAMTTGPAVSELPARRARTSTKSCREYTARSPTSGAGSTVPTAACPASVCRSTSTSTRSASTADAHRWPPSRPCSARNPTTADHLPADRRQARAGAGAPDLTG